MSAVPFKVKAVFEYKSEEPDDLNFPNGQVITVLNEEDDAWYSGEYTTAAGDKLEGLFPRNFVEKYEPAVPSRPSRAPKKAAAPEPAQEPSVAQDEPPPTRPQEPVKEADIEPPHEVSHAPATATESAGPSSPPAAPQPAVAKPVPPPTAAAGKPGPPPVADKPSSSSFKDRIAAFNKPAATPIAPFKPGGQGSTSGFIKKPFVAPPPSKNAYVPPPREPPPQKIYRREEDPSLHNGEEHEAVEPSKPTEEVADDQPKPTSLKERIALLQKQQLEQANRHAETALKKEKPKKPPKKRVEQSEEAEPPLESEHLEQLDTNETVGKKPVDATEDVAETTRSPPARQPSLQMPTPLPPRELVSDTNDADDSGAADTEDAPGTSTEEDRPRSKDLPATVTLEPVPTKKESVPESSKEVADEENAEQEDDEEEDEEEEDPEVRRRRELRDRMARLGGGMGMMGMFGPPGGAPAAGPPRKSRQSTEAQRQGSEQQHQDEVARAPPVPIMALPGMSNQLPKRTEEPVEPESDEDDAAQTTPHDSRRENETSEDYISQPPQRSSTAHSSSGLPQERAVPPPPPREIRAPPPPPATEIRAVPPPPQSPITRSVPPPPPPAKLTEEVGEDSEDEDLPQPTRRSGDGPTSPTGAPPPLPPSKSRPEQIRPQVPPRDTPQSPVSSPQSRAPPPPPPGHLPSRRLTSDSQAATGSRPQVDEDSEDEVTEYDGDYDTDIASSAKHKDALKSHNRDSSIDDGTLTDDATKSPTSPPARAIPPLPPVAAPRDVPPPPPPSAAAKSRKSTDMPRMPPPIPPAGQLTQDEEEYDPYRYSAPQHGLSSPGIQGRQGPILSLREEFEEEDMYGASTQPPRMPPPPPNERAAPPPPIDAAGPESSKQSTDVKRSLTLPRRSMEQQRPSGDQGSIASDLDLGRSSFWWTQENLPPPVLQQRSDIIFEMDTSTASTRGGKSTISKAIYVLYTDYSQTTITASFDADEPSHVTFEQTHERPPPPPRKDQLESASEQFGLRIAAAASNAANSGSTIGDGAPHSLILELIKPLPGALRPVGTRAYGALVYANLANASTQQHDEIRAGDIVTFRNAKFVGHKGTMHQKYAVDVGKPDHVGVVIDWDGTKKKIRAWEQVSREEKGKKAKVKEEGFRLGDLKSGEVRVWRVMGRAWVGWDKN